jgi:hypothetical protein
MMGSSGIKSSERDDKNGCMRVGNGSKREQEVKKINFIQSAINLTKILLPTIQHI